MKTIDFDKILKTKRIVDTLRVLLILYFVFILLLGIQGIITGPNPLMKKIFGSDLALFDYLMDAVVYLLALSVLYGLLRKTSWWYSLFILLTILVLLGEIVGMLLVQTNQELMLESIKLVAEQRGRSPTQISEEIVMLSIWLTMAAKICGYLIFLAIGYFVNKRIDEGFSEIEKIKERHPIEWKES